MAETFILAFGAHPDDVELGAGATCALHAKDGVVICDLTAAEMSSNGNPELRWKEATKAAEELGVAARICLGLRDRGLLPSADTISAIVKVIRTFQPQVVLAPHTHDRHPDHGHCAELVREALFTSGLRKHEDGLPPHRPSAFYQYFINGMHQASFAVDVSSVYEKKRSALAAYSSQFYPSSGVATPLTQSSFLPMIEGRDRMFGQAIGCDFAEGFWQTDPLYAASLRTNLK
ncbi:bacillithiol biosynthesis deacetylase BshB1 [Sulfoacidibacillus thermotolerans]|uniref:Bacillithiol biosynthesis deacetylase BshB1 n=1 Tax=Sulfoacidibacillus thermotolerans TaxID=1765684 RepID=A0A2U3D708_SULT2|nr:bacillithiol biosynthesis deacetylase BshB1 [Sulfoacidibacillus thermotolerans]PWI57069.1 bacillithiol biosynthesis deacetylase BshB1 [Sulfoacidibacillus thermotolerans]